MKTTSILITILGISLVTTVASAGALVHTDGSFTYEEVPTYNSETTRTTYEDFKLLYEGTPTYGGETLEEAEMAAFEEIGVSQE